VVYMCLYVFQVPGETNKETGLAGKKSVETVKAVSIIYIP